MSLVQEAAQRLVAGLEAAGRLAASGAKQGFSLWTRTFRSLIRSQYGPWVLLAEALLLAGVMVALWWTWQGLSAEFLKLVGAFLQALPLALLAVYLLPALACVVGAIAWKVIQALRSSR